MRKEDLNKKKFKLELDINNLTKGEKIPQISNREKHIKILENNIKNIKLIPNQLMNDLEDDVFKFIDNEFDKIHEDSKKNKKEEYTNTIND
jgi:lipoate-protein ligase A